MTIDLNRCLVLSGPTGSGKSALALAIAPRLDAEIVALDSMTLYRGMDVGTAKPSPEERAGVPHHLIDVLDPWDSANVAWWLRRAEGVVADILARGKTPLFVGGTPFYLKAITHGLFEAPPVDAALRARLEAEAERDGKEAFHRRLAEIDPASAARLHPNDTRRVVRALEVFEQTGRPLSELQGQGWFERGERTAVDARTARVVWLDLPRPELHRRIERRVFQMLDGGWVEEVERLNASGRPMSKEAAQAIGYREVAEHIRGLRTFAETRILITEASRQYAKRQLTWLRSTAGAAGVAPEFVADVWQTGER